MTGSDQPSRQNFAPTWSWDWDLRLNQIPEEWHQVAVRFRKTHEIRDGDMRSASDGLVS
ncbi:hypothetical protein EV13_1387 [Prochlorococcus sp. MIT 0702]|nr:hypothetical protein EV12_1414 [Prochlorococcus sp. MIT 0701]KGG28874.1 hypothetical protein EV13_1387 [Prochlorococcus sp. MIT 0702]KGG37194.1 hypothetical protein EV14_0137 [Prochlorococcus sp. MIT 0703]